MNIPFGYAPAQLPADAPSGARMAFASAETLVIVGRPDPDDDEHNCDAMGCRQDHVLERRQISPVRPQPPDRLN
jgi:hypothetical protein